MIYFPNKVEGGQINMKYTNFNKPVTIKLPSDAKDAVDMSGRMDFDF